MATLYTRAHVVTCDGPPGDLGAIPDGAVLVERGRIAWVGRSRDADDAARASGAVVDRREDLRGRLLTPGLVDCHTHAVFAGDRAVEFGLRAAGASYLDLAKAGGGIAATVTPTRGASSAEL